MDAAIEAFIDQIPVGVMGTVRKDGQPRLSTVYYLRDGDRLFVSTESKRGKARDVERTGRASFCVQGMEKPFPFVTIEGPATVLRSGIGDITARVFSQVLGQPVDPQTDEALAAVDRVVIEITAERTYGAYIEQQG
jgi:PPOX class probable F420-dependent enzyme